MSDYPSSTAHVPRKRFGQHFLHDQGILRRIVECISPQPGERIVEIGPGEGAMTLPLLRAAGKMTAIELDRDLIEPLREKARGVGELDIINADVLTVDFGAARRRSAAAHRRQPAVQHFHSYTFPLSRSRIEHHRHALHAAEGSRRAHGRRAGQQSVWTAQRDAAVPLQRRAIAGRAAERVPAAAESGFGHRTTDAASPPRRCPM